VGAATPANEWTLEQVAVAEWLQQSTEGAEQAGNQRSCSPEMDFVRFAEQPRVVVFPLDSSALKSYSCSGAYRQVQYVCG